jgi:DNA-binding MarR family transcriptional regulator
MSAAASAKEPVPLEPVPPEPVPLCALVSQLLVAFTIEFDNEFEHQMPHKTTNHGSSRGPESDLSHVPWLVSMAMWVHCMQYVPENGIPARELASRARLTARSAQSLLKRMSAWWGYLTIGPDPADSRPKPPAADWLVRPTRAGRRAQLVWEPLISEIEGRWQARFGGAEVAQFRAALLGIVSQLDLALPDYLTVWELRPGPRSELAGDRANTASLSALMSKVLLEFALDFQRESDLSLGIYTAGGGSRLAVAANILRVLGGEPVRVADVPDRSGVAKMSVDNWLGSLEQHRYLTVGADPAGTRFKVATLTPSGRRAVATYYQWTRSVESQWQERFGSASVSALRASAERLVTEPGARAQLWQGIEPYPDGWRAKVRRRSTLPHYPAVSHRGGFPDGS